MPGKLVSRMSKRECFTLSEKDTVKSASQKFHEKKIGCMPVVDEKKKEPGLRIFATCRNLLRTFPTLPLDDNNPEDINTHVEDHAYDALRYGCMSRPTHTSYAERFNRTPRVQFTPSDRIFG